MKGADFIQGLLGFPFRDRRCSEIGDGWTALAEGCRHSA